MHSRDVDTGRSHPLNSGGAQPIGPDAPDHRHSSPRSSRRHGLVGPLATRHLLELTTQHRFAWTRQPRNPHDHVGIDTADDHEIWHRRAWSDGLNRAVNLARTRWHADTSPATTGRATSRDNRRLAPGSAGRGPAQPAPSRREPEASRPPPAHRPASGPPKQAARQTTTSRRKTTATSTGSCTAPHESRGQPDTGVPETGSVTHRTTAARKAHREGSAGCGLGSLRWARALKCVDECGRYWLLLCCRNRLASW